MSRGFFLHQAYIRVYSFELDQMIRLYSN